jgi:hypothetical protein
MGPFGPGPSGPSYRCFLIQICSLILSTRHTQEAPVLRRRAHAGVVVAKFRIRFHRLAPEIFQVFLATDKQVLKELRRSRVYCVEQLVGQKTPVFTWNRVACLLVSKNHVELK